MAFEEKATWVSATVSTVVAAAYFVIVLGQLSTTPAAAIDYQRPLVTAIVATVVLSVLGMIAIAIAAAVAAQVSGSGSVDDIDRSDERDALIGRRGDLIGFYVGTVGIVAALVITMLEWDYFWIANLIYLSLVVTGLVSAVVKLVAYRRGF